MISLKLRQGSPLQRAIAGLVFGLFGILWTMAALYLTGDSKLPAVGIVLPGAGVLATLWYWGQAAYYLNSAANQQRFAEDDFAQHDAERSVSSALPCRQCHSALEPAFRYCPYCGTKVVNP